MRRKPSKKPKKGRAIENPGVSLIPYAPRRYHEEIHEEG